MQDKTQTTAKTDTGVVPPVVGGVQPASSVGIGTSTSTVTPKVDDAKSDALKVDVAKTEVAKPALNVMPAEDAEHKVIDKIRSSENILVTLSRDPSVDEMAAAIALTLYLDGLQKHTTAIYSGATPDALQFLQPGETFETNTDSLQDFIIALSKDKADHLRYKLDGDFVKVYITPYKTVLSEGDLEFSHGDYNVDLVLALGVPQATDLDAALAEYGRIMHDATTVDITCDAPGRFGEIEWSDLKASSVSEMVTKLIFAMEGKDAELDKEIATALLTGIVAATGRFSNNRTNSETMELASKLMAMGADQQLISANVMDNDSGTAPSPSFADYNTPAPDYNYTTNNYATGSVDPMVPVDVPIDLGGFTKPAFEYQTAQAMKNAPEEVAPTDSQAVAAANAVNDAVTAAMANVTAASGTTERNSQVVGDGQGTVLPQNTVLPQDTVLPGDTVLPPPPAPAMGDGMMPPTGNEAMAPVLPQVQVPADLAAEQAKEKAEAQAAQAAQASKVQQQMNPGAFQIPGM